MAAGAAAPFDWSQVMAAFSGLRLAIHDELLRNGSLDIAALAARLAGDGGPATALDPQKLKEAIAWLAKHRLLAPDEGKWRAIVPALACLTYETEGPAFTVELSPASPPPKPNQVRGQTAAVQRHQQEFFTNEGYRESLGSSI